jgi:hypothetical protein
MAHAESWRSDACQSNVASVTLTGGDEGRPMRISNRRKTILLALLILSPVAVLFFIWLACSPPSDAVQVRIPGRPEHIDFICLVVASTNDLKPLEWYWTYWGDWSPHRPDGKAWARPTLGTDFSPVRWSVGHRYAVVTFTRGIGWRAYWFASDEVPLSRSSTLSSRYVTFDLTGRPAEELDQAAVDRLGLSAVPDELKDNPAPP